jgi:hypothetical protein
MWMFVIGAVPMLLSGICAYGLSRTVDVLHARKPPHSEHVDVGEREVPAGHAPART